MILGLTFALNGCVYAFIPIIFYRPQFHCRDATNPDSWYACDEETGCSLGEFRAESEYEQVNSISMEFELYCEKKFIEAAILTIMAAGQILAFLIGTAIYIHPKKQYGYFIKGNIITGVCLVLASFATTPYMLIPVLFVWNTYYGLFMSVIFAHLNFFFSGTLSKFGPSAYNTGLPAFLLLYCLFSYYRGYWRDSLRYFAGIPYLLLAVLLVYFKPAEIVRKPAVTVSKLKSQADKDIESAQKTTIDTSQKELISSSASTGPTATTTKNTEAIAARLSSSTKTIKKVGQDMQLKKPRSLKPNTGLNQRLLDIDQHEVQFNAPAAATIHQKKRQDEATKILDTIHAQSSRENPNASTLPSVEAGPRKIVEESAWEDFKNQLKSIYEKPVLLKNVSLFVLCWLGTNIAYFGCLLVMGDLGGDLYTNVSFSTIFEFAGNLSATFLIIKFSQRMILRISFLVVGLSYLLCLIVDPTQQEVGNGYTVKIIISLIPIVIAKGTHEMLWTVLQTYLNTILPPEFHQFSFACSNLVSVIIMDIMPFYKFIMEKMRLNQFLGYAVYCLFIAYIVKYFEDLYKEDGKPINKDDLLNDDAAHPLNMRPVESQKPIELIKMPEAPNQGDKDDELLCTI